MYMRTWGRLPDADGALRWVKVETDSRGFNDAVWLTTLCQSIRLNVGESPFFANIGIPQQQTIVSQVWPDFYATQLQTLYASRFASLTILRTQNAANEPTYKVNVVLQTGVSPDMTKIPY